MVQIKRILLDPQQVPGRSRLHVVLPEQLAQLGDMHLQRLRRTIRRLVLPDGINQVATGDDPVRIQEQHDQERPLLRPGDVDRTPSFA